MTAVDTAPGVAGDQGEAEAWPEVTLPGGPAAAVVEAVAGGGTASPPVDETAGQQAPARGLPADPIGRPLPVHASRPPAGSGPASSAPGAPGAHDVCRSTRCRQKIRWAKTETGDAIPVDYAPDPGGRLVRVMKSRGDWRIRVLPVGAPPPAAGEIRWTSHFATCPEATRFRARDQRPSSAPGSPAPPVLEVVAPAGPERLLVVDGNSLAHRSFHALAGTGMRTPDGEPMWALFGFLKLLAGVCERVRPDAVLVGFDDRAGSARRDRYPEYKAGRSEKDPALYAQLDQLPAVLADLGVATMIPPGLEADDVLASSAAAAERAGWRCTVATSDRDALRLVSAATTVLQLGNGLDAAVNVTPASLEAKYGVRPEQYPDFCVLVGDRSDNLPGVLGIGKTKAAALLAAVGTLDAALDEQGAPVPAAVAAIGKGYAGKLTAPGAAERIARNRDLMALVAGLPVDPGACRPRLGGGAIAKVLKAWHMPSLIRAVVDALAAPDTTGARLVPVPAPPAAAPALAPGSVVRGLLAPTLEQAAAGQDEHARTCAGCATVCAARVPLVGGEPGETVLLVAEHLLGDVVMVRVGDGWAAERCAGWAGRRENRRRVHRCETFTGWCVTPGHGDRPAHLYPGGFFCAECIGHQAAGRVDLRPGQRSAVGSADVR